MRRLLLNIIDFDILLLVILTGNIYCQTGNVVQNRIVSSELRADTSQVNILNQISEKYVVHFPDSSLIYSRQALKLAQQLNYRAGIENSFLMIGKATFNKNLFKESLIFYHKVFNLADPKADKKIIVKTNYEYGLSLYYLAQYNESLTYFYKARNQAKAVDDNIPLASSTLMIGTVLSILGKDNEATKYEFEALEISEKNNDTQGTADAALEIGNIYDTMKNQKKAITYYEKAEVLYKVINDLWNLQVVNECMGDIYEERHDHKTALEYYFKAMKFAYDTKDPIAIGEAESSIGRIYSNMKEYDNSINYNKRALENLELTQDSIRTLMAIVNIGYSYLKLGRIDDAIFYLNRGLKKAVELKSFDDVSNCYHYLSSAFEEKKDYKKSLEYFKLFKNSSDSVYNIAKAKQILDVQTKYETEKEKNENVLLKKDEALQNEIIKRQYGVLLVVLGSFILMMIIAVLLFKLNSQKKKLNIQLVNQKKEIEEYASKLHELNAAKDKFFTIIAHDLKNPFHSIIGITNLLVNDPHELSNEEKSLTYRMIYDTSKNAYALLGNLLQWAQSQTGRIEFVATQFYLREVIDKSTALLQGLANEKSIGLHVEIPPDLKVHADKNMIETVVRNLLNNAIKFTERNGHVDLYCAKDGEKVIISIKDNGVGIQKEVAENLFKIDSVHSTIGTNKETGSGLGLLLCKEFVLKNSGEIWVESELGKGSTFYFSLPLA